MITLLILKILFVVEMVFKLADCIYRIITEEDRSVSWKTQAVVDIIDFTILLLLFLGLIFEW